MIQILKKSLVWLFLIPLLLSFVLGILFWNTTFTASWLPVIPTAMPITLLSGFATSFLVTHYLLLTGNVSEDDMSTFGATHIIYALILLGFSVDPAQWIRVNAVLLILFSLESLYYTWPVSLYWFVKKKLSHRK